MPQAGSAEPDQIAGLFAAIDKILGRVNSPVNNAAMPAKRSKLESFGFARAVHVRGYYDQPNHYSQQAVRRTSYRHSGRGGAVIDMSSASVRPGRPDE